MDKEVSVLQTGRRAIVALLLVIGLATSLSGCYALGTIVQLPDESVADAKKGNDCAAILLGLGGGDTSVAQAMKNGGLTKVRYVEVTDMAMLVFIIHCVEVHGEGIPDAAEPGLTPHRQSDTDTGYDYRRRK